MDVVVGVKVKVSETVSIEQCELYTVMGDDNTVHAYAT